jgi:hypothetical protein
MGQSTQQIIEIETNQILQHQQLCASKRFVVSYVDCPTLYFYRIVVISSRWKRSADTNYSYLR